MKNVNQWKPTKFVRRKDGVLIASRDPNEVSISSRLTADLTAEWYDLNIKNFANGDLLDLGAGKAPLYSAYKPYVKSVTLADWANSPHENKHLDVFCDITKKLPFKKDQFDTIILSDVLEHIPNPKDLILELKRILKPQGIVLMNVPFMYQVHEAPHDYHRYTEFMLEKMLKDANMKVIKIDALGGGWTVFIDLTSKLLYRRPTVARLIQVLGPRIFKTRLKSRTEFPISYAVVFKKVSK